MCVCVSVSVCVCSWAEVSLLLRKPIASEQDMLYTVAASEAGLMYIDQMDSIAKNMKVMRGALTRWLLPYDNNTRYALTMSPYPTPPHHIPFHPLRIRTSLNVCLCVCRHQDRQPVLHAAFRPRTHAAGVQRWTAHTDTYSTYIHTYTHTPPPSILHGGHGNTNANDEADVIHRPWPYPNPTSSRTRT